MREETCVPLFLGNFIKKRKISLEVGKRLLEYADLVIEWNQKFNLTAKESSSSFFKDVIADSSKLYDFFDSKKIKSIVDVGTGSGIPGIVLKLLNPELKLVLVEVNKKKIGFLKHVINFFKLENVEIVDMDWRTFTRKTDYEVDFLVSKAVFNQDEIIRMFRFTSNYKNKFMVYWSNALWSPTKEAAPFVRKKILYNCNFKKLQFIVFAEPDANIEQYLLKN